MVEDSLANAAGYMAEGGTKTNPQRQRGSQESPHDRDLRKHSVGCMVDQRIRFLADGTKSPSLTLRVGGG